MPRDSIPLRKESRTLLEYLNDRPDKNDPVGVSFYDFMGQLDGESPLTQRAVKELISWDLIESPYEVRYTITPLGEALVQQWRSPAGRFSRSRLGGWLGKINDFVGAFWDHTNHIIKVVGWLGSAVLSGLLVSC